MGRAELRVHWGDQLAAGTGQGGVYWPCRWPQRRVCRDLQLETGARCGVWQLVWGVDPPWLVPGFDRPARGGFGGSCSDPCSASWTFNWEDSMPIDLARYPAGSRDDCRLRRSQRHGGPAQKTDSRAGGKTPCSLSPGLIRKSDHAHLALAQLRCRRFDGFRAMAQRAHAEKEALWNGSRIACIHQWLAGGWSGATAPCGLRALDRSGPRRWRRRGEPAGVMWPAHLQWSVA